MVRCAATLPLCETGGAPRYLVTGAERLERVQPGLFCFSLTHEIIIDRQRIRRVEIYLDCTPTAIAEGLGLLARHAPELIGFPKIWTGSRH